MKTKNLRVTDIGKTVHIHSEHVDITGVLKRLEAGAKFIALVCLCDPPEEEIGQRYLHILVGDWSGYVTGDEEVEVRS